ncbi:MAG: hypothetical protein ACREXP_27180, partial [Steroidobacteraceae bacterium]
MAEMATPVDEARTAEHDSQPHYGLGLCLRAAVACLAVVVFGAGGIFAFHPTSLGSHESVVAAVGFAGGIGVVITSFVASSLVIAWADVVDRKMILPVGLMTYVLKIAAIGVVVFGLARK